MLNHQTLACQKKAVFHAQTLGIMIERAQNIFSSPHNRKMVNHDVRDQNLRLCWKVPEAGLDF
jgi:hypothetical protein